MIASSETNLQRRYRLIAEIGRGGMAEVYLAVAQGPAGFNKLVVVKKALPNLALQPDILAMFMDEARLAARMNHPNVVQTYEFGEEDARKFIAMEFLDGQPYSRVLGRLRGRTSGLETMSVGHHVRVLLDTLAGLHHAHELRDFDGSPLHVVHRDVTPQNVFVTYDGGIKVVDFGIAKAQDSSSRTVTGEIKGKVTYMSPEQVRGEPLDRRSDLFAVGVMLWEAVAGRRMWTVPDVTVVHELMHDRIPSIRQVAPNAPPELVRIIERALATDREERFPSALAMHRELDELAVMNRLRVDSHEVGRVVAELFDEERRRVRGVIETQLGSLRWTGENPSAGNLPVIPEANGAITGGPWPAAESQRMIEPPRPSGPGSAGPISGIPTNSGAALPMPSQAMPARRSVVAPLVIAAVAATVAVALVITFERPSVRAPEAARTGTGSAEATAAPDAVTLKVRASPASAKILLDGVLLGAGSYEGKVARSDKPKVLRVEAEGHTPKEEPVSLSSDVVMSFSLDKHVDATTSAAAPSSSAKVGPGPGVRPRTTTTATSTGRGIDEDSPYGNRP